jgi:hypothetical protein
LEHGHHGASAYTVGRLWVEARLVRDRIRHRLADEATMLHAVVVGAMSDPKHLKRFLEDLEDGD